MNSKFVYGIMISIIITFFAISHISDALFFGDHGKHPIHVVRHIPVYYKVPVYHKVPIYHKVPVHIYHKKYVVVKHEPKYESYQDKSYGYDGWDGY